MADDKPIIVIKKKGGHGGHHGGAWKIAYADFVTAMMAFFMVMWLVNSASVVTKRSIATYFRRPGIFTEGSGTPLQIGGAGILEDAAAPPETDDFTQGAGGSKSPQGKEVDEEPKKRKPVITPFSAMTPISTAISRAMVPLEVQTALPSRVATALPRGQQEAGTDRISTVLSPLERLPERQEKGLAEQKGTEQAKILERQRFDFEKLAEQIREEIAASPELQKLLGSVDVKIDADGLNIEIMDTEKASMFSSGSARIQPEARAAFAKLAGIMAKLPNTIDIIGHTDGKPYSSSADGYSNWDLSADRANAARRLLEQYGIEPKRITSIVGRADQDLKLPNEPFGAANRRITLKMKFDLKKKIDLSREPDALNRENLDRALETELPTPQPLPQPLDPAPPGETGELPDAALTPAAGAQATAEREIVHSLTAKEVLEGQKQRKREKLPEAEPSASNPAPARKGGVFNDNPVLGPPDPFFGF